MRERSIVKVLGYAIDEEILLRVAAKIGERQNHNGQVWRSCTGRVN